MEINFNMDVLIYTKDNCPYCVNAKTWFKENNVTISEINISEDADAKAELLAEYPDTKTVPQIFLVDQGQKVHIGGYNDLVSRMDEVKRLLF